MQKPAVQTSKNIEKARRLYLTTKEGIADSEMAQILGVSHRTANRYRIALDGKETFQNSAKYTIEPTEDELEFAKGLLRRAGFRIVVDYDGIKELEEKLEQEMIEEDY